MRTPWLAGTLLLLTSAAHATTVQNDRHWLFGHRCGVTFDAAGPSAWLVPNESFAAEGFSTAWSDPVDGALLLYGDGRDVWRGRDHVLLHQGSAGPLPLQASGLMALPGAAGKYAAFVTEPAVPPYLGAARLSVLALDDTPEATQTLSTYSTPRTALLVAGTTGALVASWTAAHTIDFWNGTESIALRGDTLTTAGRETLPVSPAPRLDGETSSQSWSGNAVVYVDAPGAIILAGRLPVLGAGSFTSYLRLDVLEAGDTTGHVHHAQLSLDGTKLYVGIDDGDAGDRADVVQLDLTNGNARTLLGRAVGTHSPSFGLGPDGKMYVASFQGTTDQDVLAVIDDPDRAGAHLDPTGLPMAAGCDVRRGLVSFARGGARLLDSDHDGVLDFADVDNDQDGLDDVTESGSAAALDVDADADGIADWNQIDAVTCATPGSRECSQLTTPFDADADDVPALNDLDADGDGVFDLWQCGGSALDADRDGRIDGPADADGRASALVGVSLDCSPRALEDAGAPDAGPLDAGVPDAGVPDAGVIEAGAPDASPPQDAPDAAEPGPNAGGGGCQTAAAGPTWELLLWLAFTRWARALRGTSRRSGRACGSRTRAARRL